MSNIKFSNNLFLDSLELKRLNRFIFKDGFESLVLENTREWGIIKNRAIDDNFNYFRISQGAPVSGNITFQMSNGFGIGYDPTLEKVRYFKNNFNNFIPFPQDGNWYWIKVTPEYKKYESGKITVDVSGNVIGVDTKFTEILRGQPDFPSKIKFYKLLTDQLTYNPSTLNSLEYDVLEVISDTSLILQGTFQNETDLYYSVIGTFTPGYVVPSQDKEIFQYDDCKIEIVAEGLTALKATKPTHTANFEFLIYRIKYESGNLIIQDYRNEIYKTKSDFEIDLIENSEIPLIGIESIEYDNKNTPRDKNLVGISWVFKVDSYTINLNLNKISIASGNGGKFKTSNDFSTSQFDRWRVYVLDSVRNVSQRDSYISKEKYSIINSSTKNGTGIDLLLDKITPQDFIPENYNIATAYKNNDKVSVGTTYYKLLSQSSTGQDPSQTVWSSATTYSINDLKSFGNGVYISLSNGNLNNQPDVSATFWTKIWQTFVPKIILTPDVEEITIDVSVGTEVNPVISDSATLNKTFTFPVKQEIAKIPVTSINISGSIDYPIYNFKYSTKNNKVYGQKFVLPADIVGYVNETGVVTPYSSDFNKSFVKIYKSPFAYSNFVDKIDTGDLFGVEFITNLESTAAGFAAHTIPFVVGVRKQNVEITGDVSTPLTDNVKLNLISAGAKSGSKFYIYLKSKIDGALSISNQATGFNIQITKDGGASVHTLTRDQVERGDQFFICTYDSVLSDWEIVHSDVSFDSSCVFKEGKEIVSTATNLVNFGTNNVLVVSGLYENISVINPSGSEISIHGIRTLNGKFINNLKISCDGSSSSSLRIREFSEWSGATFSYVNRFFIKDSLFSSDGGVSGNADIKNNVILPNALFDFVLNSKIYDRVCTNTLAKPRTIYQSFNDLTPTGSGGTQPFPAATLTTINGSYTVRNNCVAIISARSNWDGLAGVVADRSWEFHLCVNGSIRHTTLLTTRGYPQQVPINMTCHENLLAGDIITLKAKTTSIGDSAAFVTNIIIEITQFLF